MGNHDRVELLAPAGNAAGFYGAVHAGADAVYLAGDRFGARAYAENFTTQELVECIRYGHLLGRKIYLTVNTLLKDSELTELYEYLTPFYEAGLDAVIVQDLGVFRFIREHFPELKLHVSTQMTVCSGFGAALLKDMGACRVVPARELTLRELVALKQHSGVEVEAFVHGAMCYCYSGQCLFSSILGGRSGNRGRCAQPCRLPYSAGTGTRHGECYPLSLKDMCTIEHIPQLIEAGIDSFKIEGRMKKPEYAAGVTDIYRRYIDRYYDMREKKGAQEAAKLYRVEQEDQRTLASLYVRSGLQNGYYFRHSGREMITMDSPAYSGSDEKTLAGIQEKHLKDLRKLPVTVKAFFRTGRPAMVTLQWKQIQAEVEGPVVEPAQKQPVTEANIRKQLCKLGDSAFYAAQVEIDLDENCFYPLKQINELRRMAVAELEEKILLHRGYGARAVQNVHNPSEISSENTADKPAKAFDHAFSIRTRPQLKALADWILTRKAQTECAGTDNTPLRIYIDGDLLIQEWEEIVPLCESLSDCVVLYAAFPYILRETDRGYLEALYEKVEKSRFIHGFLARSMDGLGFLREKGNTMPCRADAGIYTWNQEALRELADLTEGFCLPYELNAYEQKQLLTRLSEIGLTRTLSCEKIIYSRIPMMITANCVRQTVDKCRLKQQKASAWSGHNAPEPYTTVLKDRYRKEFPVLQNCMHCMNIIYNSVPFSLHQELPKWRGRIDLRMDFSLESGEEVRRLLDCFLERGPFPQAEYTTGHEKRGVE